MKPTNDLFLLIKSLTKTEKRYFHLFAARHVIGGESMYLKFFDVIVKQKEYDENKIKDIFKKEDLGTNLAAGKNRLYNLILESLSDYHSSITIESKLRGMIQQVEVLWEKNLHEQAMKIIKKAKTIATENDKHLYFLELLRMERKLVFNLSPDINSSINTIYTEAFYHTDQYKNTLHIQQMHAKAFAFHKIYGKVRSKSDLVTLKQMVGPLTGDLQEKQMSTSQKRTYYQALSLYYRISGDLKKGYDYMLKERALNTTPADNAELFLYASSLHNMCLAQMEFFKYGEALETVHEIRQLLELPISKKSSNIRLITTISYINELNIHFSIGDFDKGVQTIKHAQKEFDKYSTSVPPAFVINFWYAYSIVYFGAEDYKKSMTWLYKVINFPDQNSRLDLLCIARIFSLIVHYELNNEVMLPYYVKSVYRYLLKKQRLFKLETFIIEFIRKKMPKIHSAKDQKAAFIELKDDLILLQKDPHENYAFDYFDFISWLESKIEKKPFAEIIREKAKHF